MVAQGRSFYISVGRFTESGVVTVDGQLLPDLKTATVESVGINIIVIRCLPAGAEIRIDLQAPPIQDQEGDELSEHIAATGRLNGQEHVFYVSVSDGGNNDTVHERVDLLTALWFHCELVQVQ
jgi:hypothetical protein